MSFNIIPSLRKTKVVKNTHPYIYTFKNETIHGEGLNVYQKLRSYFSDQSSYKFEGYEMMTGNYAEDIVELWSTEKIDLEDTMFVIEFKKYLIDERYQETISIPINISTDE